MANYARRAGALVGRLLLCLMLKFSTAVVFRSGDGRCRPPPTRAAFYFRERLLPLVDLGQETALTRTQLAGHQIAVAVVARCRPCRRRTDENWHAWRPYFPSVTPLSRLYVVCHFLRASVSSRMLRGELVCTPALPNGMLISARLRQRLAPVPSLAARARTSWAPCL